MATIYTNPKDLPQRNVSIPNAKPPVMKVPRSTQDDPEEADEFVDYVRQLRGKPKLSPRNPK
ncbi:MAG: hypothetical protein HY820_06900 [Acidobacteria bacterium]|nr:hypothetical protein [Acidobacteriota bacterium]